jgi:hypothetical protein
LPSEVHRLYAMLVAVISLSGLMRCGHEHHEFYSIRELEKYQVTQTLSNVSP